MRSFWGGYKNLWENCRESNPPTPESRSEVEPGYQGKVTLIHYQKTHEDWNLEYRVAGLIARFSKCDFRNLGNILHRHRWKEIFAEFFFVENFLIEKNSWKFFGRKINFWSTQNVFSTKNILDQKISFLFTKYFFSTKKIFCRSWKKIKSTISMQKTCIFRLVWFLERLESPRQR